MYNNHFCFLAVIASTNHITGFSDTIQTISSIIEILLKAVLVLGGFVGIVIFAILILAVLTTIIFIVYLPLIFDSISKLGVYHKLIERKSDKNQICEFGENILEKIWKVFCNNLWIAIPLFIILLFLFHPQATSTITSEFDLTNISTNVTNSSSHNSNEMTFPDISFFLSLSLIPAFLLSFRIFVNPTRWGLITYKNGMTSGFYSTEKILVNLIKKRKFPEEKIELISVNERIKMIRAYKEQIISFYYTFISATLILFFLYVSFEVVKTHGLFDIVSAFSPTMNLIAVVLMIIAEIFAIFLITIIGELYLKIFEPIDQI